MCCKLCSLWANESCDEHAVFFRWRLKWPFMFTTFLLFRNDAISLESRPLNFVKLYTHTTSIQKQIVEYHVKVNILKNTQPSIKEDVKNFQWRNPASCRIKHLFISYLISKQQARLNTFLRVLLFWLKINSIYCTMLSSYDIPLPPPGTKQKGKKL